jgi:Zn-dependent protease with chaperone function
LSDARHVKFEGLDPHSYVHPLDNQALAALKAIPGIDTILKKFLSLTFESYARVSFTASAVRVGKKQCPDLNAKLEIAAATLAIPRPELFVSVSDLIQGGVGYNAFTTGYEKPFVVVNSLLLERLSDEEVLSVLGHELGHIHSQHMLYRAAAVTLVLLARFAMLSSPVTAGIATLLTLPIQAALLNWYHKSELSADRAALLVVQNPDTVVSTLVKLAGGTLASQIDHEEFIAQAREFQKNYDQSIMDKIWTLIAAAQTTHPFAVWRVSEILSWVESGQYQKVLEGTKKLPQ